MKRNATWRRLLTAETGIAMPVALMLLVVIAGLVTVTATESYSATRGAGRDKAVKRAIAAADAGVSVATYRLNRLDAGPLACVAPDPTSGQLVVTSAMTDGWCAAQTEDLGDGAGYSYRVSTAADVTVNGQGILQRKIVSTGTVNGVARRVITVLATASGRDLFGDFTVISLNDLSMPNSTRISGNVASNGKVALSNSAEICGNVTYGPGKQFTADNSSHQCGGYAQGPATLPIVLDPVDEGTAATVNDNARIGVQDSLTGGSLPSAWDPVKRVLSLKNSMSLMLTGNVYSFCSLQLSGKAQLVVAARSTSQPPLKIFMDDPASCPGVTSAGSVRVIENSFVQNLNASATSLQFWMLGSATAETTMELSNSFSSQLAIVIYASRSTVSLQNGQNLVGAVAAKNLLMSQTSSITSQNVDISVDTLIRLFQRQSWLECTATSGSGAPDGGC
jgi:hypothetical protein